MGELGIILHNPVNVLCDNILATCITANPVLHDRSKHIKVDYHFVHERVSHGDLVVTYVSTQLQLADIFTKALPVQYILFWKSNLSVDSPHPDRGEIIEDIVCQKYEIIFVNPSCIH